MSKHESKTYVFTKTFQNLQIGWIFEINVYLYSTRSVNNEIFGYLDHIFKQKKLIQN